MGWQWFGARDALASVTGEQLSFVREQVMAFANGDTAYNSDTPAAA